MPCHAMLCHTIPCHAMPCHAMPCHTIPYRTAPHHTTPYHITPYQTTPYRTTEVNSSIIYPQEDVQKIKSLEKDLKEARAKPSGGGGAEDVSDRCALNLVISCEVSQFLIVLYNALFSSRELPQRRQRNKSKVCIFLENGKN